MCDTAKIHNVPRKKEIHSSRRLNKSQSINQSIEQPMEGVIRCKIASVLDQSINQSIDRSNDQRYDRLPIHQRHLVS